MLDRTRRLLARGTDGGNAGDAGTAERRQALADRCDAHAPNGSPPGRTDRSPPQRAGGVRLPRRRRARLRRRVAGRTAEQGLRGGDLLRVLHPEAAGQARLRGVHRHGLLHQRRQRDPRANPPRPRRAAWPDHRRRRGARQADTRRGRRATGGAVSEIGGEARREPGAPQRRHEVGVVPKGPVRASAHVCEAASCLSSQSDRVLKAISEGVRRAGLTDVAVKRVGCLGLCAAGPLVEVSQIGRLFEHVQPDADGGASVDGVVEALRSLEPGQVPAPRAPFFSRQLRVVTENSGRIDPESLDDYLAAGGYQALRGALTTMNPAQVIEEVTRSGLRGRGGAGYPTGLKWSTVAKAPGDAKYVICNADEGDPGAFMDRSVLESDPHRVLEGMAIAGYAVGAAQGYVYCRAEYPLAVARLKTAIRLATRAGLLGGDIADTPFSFSVEIRLGAGAFVCGEETALIASVQGGRGSPRPRPPYPAVSGLWGRPTLINNVETFAGVAPILRNGGDWYAG